MDDAADKTERAIAALIDAEPIVPGDALPHANALRRVISESGLSLAARMPLQERLDRRTAAWLNVQKH